VGDKDLERPVEEADAVGRCDQWELHQSSGSEMKGWNLLEDWIHSTRLIRRLRQSLPMGLFSHS
jgi:hypothetical protein